MKKYLLLLFSLLLTLTACTNQNTATSSANTPTPVNSETAIPNETINTDDTESSEKTLVVYFSAQNHTKTIAEIIAREENADLFEIVPTEAYSNADLDWTDSDSRVNKEHDDETLQDIALENTNVTDWDSYDTVYIGYPIWWGDNAWPIRNFVKDNDFTAKTVIPFCTSASSPLGESASNLKNLTTTGNWLEGKRFSSNAGESEIKDWLTSIK